MWQELNVSHISLCSTSKDNHFQLYISNFLPSDNPQPQTQPFIIDSSAAVDITRRSIENDVVFHLNKDPNTFSAPPSANIRYAFANMSNEMDDNKSTKVANVHELDTAAYKRRIDVEDQVANAAVILFRIGYLGQLTDLLRLSGEGAIPI